LFNRGRGKQIAIRLKIGKPANIECWLPGEPVLITTRWNFLDEFAGGCEKYLRQTKVRKEYFSNYS